ncbi:MAG: hypothetical protein ACRDN9_11910 [Streptosporangiaceae bacterium]
MDTHPTQPGHFTRTSRLGHTYDVHPEPIINPLPDPEPPPPAPRYNLDTDPPPF